MESKLTEEIKYNLLIIDQSDLTTDDISVSALSEEGFKTVTLPDHFEALSQLGELRPDLIVLGEGLAEDNFEACRHLRQATGIPVVILGTTPRSRGWVRAIKAGADLYLARPVRQAELAARIKAILRRREWACASG
jgi:two-component system OmpR family response regulator